MNILGTNIKINRYKIIYLIIVFFFIYILIYQVGIIKQSYFTIHFKDLKYYLIAFIFVLCSFMASSYSYLFLSNYQLKLIPTFIFQFVANLLNKILPSGIGALSMNYLYLHKNGISKMKSGFMVILNNLLGLIANLLILLLIFILNIEPKINFKKIHFSIIFVSLGIISVLIVAIFVGFPQIRRYIKKFYFEIKQGILFYKNNKRNLLFSFVFQILINLFNVICLYYCLLSIGVNLSILNVYVAYSIGVFFGSFIPLPGGLGGLETGLGATLMLYGLSLNSSISAILVFRLLSYWLPLILAIPAFYISKKNKVF